MSDELDIIYAACPPWPFIEDEAWLRLTDTQRSFIAIMTVDGQVSNGGFHAVYYNNCGAYMPLAHRGLLLIGANAEAEIVQSVMQMMESDPWAGPPETWPVPKRHEPPQGAGDIGEYDDRWYALGSIEMWKRMCSYIKEHPDEFARAPQQ